MALARIYNHLLQPVDSEEWQLPLSVSLLTLPSALDQATLPEAMKARDYPRRPANSGLQACYSRNPLSTFPPSFILFRIFTEAGYSVLSTPPCCECSRAVPASRPDRDMPSGLDRVSAKFRPLSRTPLAA